MNNLLTDLEKKLSTLKDSNKLYAIKAEFEAEGTRIDELAVLSQLCCKYEIPLTLKIGGPIAGRDIYEAFQLGASNILVPMIESEFAVKQCAETFTQLKPAFTGLKFIPKLLINIETKIAFKNIKEIVNVIDLENLPINTFVIGRSDLSESYGISNVNSEKILEISKKVLKSIENKDIDATIGGNLKADSFNFFDSLYSNKLTKFESRKCTFKATERLSKHEFIDLLNKGLEFELSWLKYKEKLYLNRSKEEILRINIINERLNKK